MNVTFIDIPHHLHPFVTKYDYGISSHKVLGQPLILRNIEILKRVYNDINIVSIEDRCSREIKLIQDNFPSIEIQRSHDEDQEHKDYDEEEITISHSEIQFGASDRSSGILTHTDFGGNGSTILEESSLYWKRKLKLNQQDDSILYVPFNSVLWVTKKQEKQYVLADLVTYPWDFLSITQKILNEVIIETRISPSASVAKSSIIEGPCIIEEGSTIDDFSKIKGPTYIGKDCHIGMGSLVRNCVLENNTRIGFNCEIGKSYFSGYDKISHHNVILDSLLGENVWFGGYSGTANVLLDRRNIKYQIDDRLISTQTDHFGTVIGNNCAIGASVIILPGRQIQPNSTIQAGTIVGKQ